MLEHPAQRGPVASAFDLVVLSSFFGSSLIGFAVVNINLFPARLALLVMLTAAGLTTLLSGRLPSWPSGSAGQVLLFFAFWLLYAVASLAWAASKELGIRYVLILGTGIGILVGAGWSLRRQQDLARFAALWSIGYVVLLGVGLAEMATGTSLFSRSLIESRYGPAPAAVFGNPNDYATFLVLGLPVVLVAQRRRSSSLMLGSAMATAVFLVLIRTDSRANMIAFLLAVSGFAIANLRTRLGGPMTAVAGIVMLMTLAVATLAAVDSDQFDVVLGFAKSDTSDDIRLEVAEQVLDLVLRSFGVGVGAGNIEFHLGDLDEVGTTNAHNWFLEIAGNFGLAILLGFIAIYGIVTFNLWLIGGGASPVAAAARGAFASMVAFLPASLSSSSLVGTLFVWLVFGWAIAIIGVAHAQASQEELGASRHDAGKPVPGR